MRFFDLWSLQVHIQISGELRPKSRAFPDSWLYCCAFFLEHVEVSSKGPTPSGTAEHEPRPILWMHAVTFKCHSNRSKPWRTLSRSQLCCPLCSTGFLWNWGTQNGGLKNPTDDHHFPGNFDQFWLPPLWNTWNLMLLWNFLKSRSKSRILLASLKTEFNPMSPQVDGTVYCKLGDLQTKAQWNIRNFMKLPSKWPKISQDADFPQTIFQGGLHLAGHLCMPTDCDFPRRLPFRPATWIGDLECHWWSTNGRFKRDLRLVPLGTKVNVRFSGTKCRGHFGSKPPNILLRFVFQRGEMSVLAWAKGDKPGPGGRPQESSLESRPLTVYTPRGGRAPKSGSGPSDRGRTAVPRKPGVGIQMLPQQLRSLEWQSAGSSDSKSRSAKRSDTVEDPAQGKAKLGKTEGFFALGKWCQVIRSAAPVMQNHLPQTEDLMLQNAALLRKSAPGHPNSSDEHVSCTAPATENSSLQILFKCPTPAIAFWHATKPSCFVHFWHGAQSFAPATRNDIWMSKSAPYPSVLLHFWLGNVLRATRACTFGLAHGPPSFVASTITQLQVWMNASTDSKKYPWQWWTILVSCWRTWLNVPRASSWPQRTWNLHIDKSLWHPETSATLSQGSSTPALIRTHEVDLHELHGQPLGAGHAVRNFCRRAEWTNRCAQKLFRAYMDHFFDEDLFCLPPSWASCLTQRPFARKESFLSAQSFLAFQTCCWWLTKSKHKVSSPLRWLPA